MSFTPLPLNTAKDALLVEQKAGTSATIDTDDGSISTYHKPDYSQLSTAGDPTPLSTDTGVTLEYTDTGDRFRWTGLLWIRTHTEGALDVNTEINTNLVDLYFSRDSGTTSTLSVATAADGSDFQITVVSDAAFTVGDEISMGSSQLDTYPTITAKPGANVLTLDRRIDRLHAIGTTVEIVITDFASSAGTMAAPLEYIIKPETGEIYNMTRILLAMTHGTAGDLGLFGNLAALTNGLTLRVNIGGQYDTITNWKTNADIKADVYDVDFDTRSGGGGTFGTSARGTFIRFGAVVRLTDADSLEFYVQDSLTALTSFKIKGEGHQL